MKKKAFDYGRYECLMSDPRTKAILKAVDLLSKKMGVGYTIIGGMAVCLYETNPPPDDMPDIDYVLFSTTVDAREFIETLSQRPRFSLLKLDLYDFGVFGSLRYDREIQVDLMTSLENQRKPPKSLRKMGADIEPVEHLIIEKLITSKPHDIAAVLDLLAYVDYDKALLGEMAREKNLFHELSSLEYHARTMAAGRLSDKGIAGIVRRFSS